MDVSAMTRYDTMPLSCGMDVVRILHGEGEGRTITEVRTTVFNTVWRREIRNVAPLGRLFSSGQQLCHFAFFQDR